MLHNPAIALLAYVTLARIGELILSARHTRALLGRGAYEVGARHYPLMVAFHTAYLAALWFFGMQKALVEFWLVVVIALQFARYWVIATLGQRWTTRIIVLPNAPLVRSGPFRYCRHPNYLVVAFEIPAIALALRLPLIAFIFGSLNLLILQHRIRVEETALTTTVA